MRLSALSLKLRFFKFAYGKTQVFPQCGHLQCLTVCEGRWVCGLRRTHLRWLARSRRCLARKILRIREKARKKIVALKTIISNSLKGRKKGRQDILDEFTVKYKSENPTSRERNEINVFCERIQSSGAI